MCFVLFHRTYFNYFINKTNFLTVALNQRIAMKRTAVLFITSILMLSAQGIACAITFDFDSITPGVYTESEFNAFFSGVTFGNTAGDYFEVQTISLSPDFSPTQAAINYPLAAVGGSTIANFDYLASFVSVTMGDYNSDQDDLYLYAYDSSNNQLDDDYYYNPGASTAGHTLSVSTATRSIAYVEFYAVGIGETNSIYWDNFTFDDYVVPEPASLFLLGMGLLGIVGKIKKKY